MAEKKKPEKGDSTGTDGGIIIKKYANRRLYNTDTSSYVTLEDLARMVQEGKDFAVRDAKTGRDITHSVLTQIIFEKEAKEHNLLPNEFLRQLITFYGDSLQNFLPSYLEMSMNAFSRDQESMRTRMRDTFGAAPGYAMFEESIRKNMELYGQITKMFTPSGDGSFMKNAPEAARAAGQPGENGGKDGIEELETRVASLQAELDRLRKKGDS